MLGFSKARKKASSYSLEERFSMALRLMEWGDYHSAGLILEDCLECAPHLAALYFYLAEIERLTKNSEEAIKYYKQYLELEMQDSLGASIKLFHLGYSKQPPTLPISYIECLFDQYSKTFDKCLLENLDYCVPAQAYALANEIYPEKKYEMILDLGCGTGLSGATFRDDGVFLEGVDISAGMISEASKKNIYNALQNKEISEFLNLQTTEYDLILCIDTLIYIGVIENMFCSISKSLRDSGVCIFSTQLSADLNLCLGEDHRYSHGQIYIEETLNKAGLNLLKVKNIVLRIEHGQPVSGQIYAVSKC